MYIDTLLFIIGAVCALLLIFFIIYLALSSGRSKIYRKFVGQETEFYTKSSKRLRTSGKSSSIPIANLSDSEEDTLDVNLTKKLDENKRTVFDEKRNGKTPQKDFNIETVRKNFYEPEEEIKGGGMSRVFVARNMKLGESSAGNRWIIKFVPNEIGDLSCEQDKLTAINHSSLPKIVNIFSDEGGTYLVENYIEGETLNKVMEAEKTFNQFRLLEWTKQLCGVLSYLHKLADAPIYHFDIKPLNIMATYDDRLMVIDFGISKKHGESDMETTAISEFYAAPEQFTADIYLRFQDTIKTRFGSLPSDYTNWIPDARTDIFSLGVVLFELAAGEIPNAHNLHKIKSAVSIKFAEIILKCINIHPDMRYQSVDELSADVRKTEEWLRTFPRRRLLARKFAAAATAVSFFLSGSGFMGGYYFYGQENLSVLESSPEVITISLQQSSDLRVEKYQPNGKVVTLDNNSITWTFDSDNIAKVDGSRLVGMNPGTTELSGKYRDKLISLTVNVVEPMNGTVNISQRYQAGRSIKLFGGTLEREHIDGSINEAEFVSPESMDIAADGTVYIADSGILRKIKGSQVETIEFAPSYMKPNIVRCYKNDVYILTHEWEEPDGSYVYGIIHLNENGGNADEIYTADAVYTAIEDFAFSSGGDLYFIERNAGINEVYLKMLDVSTATNINTVCVLQKGTVSLTFGENNTIYFANNELGVIQRYENGVLNYLAGVKNDRHFIDGTAPLFYMPQKIKYADNKLYIWDFNTLRQISLDNGIAADCITVAGEASPEFESDNIEKKYAAESIILPNSRLTDFAVDNSRVLLTDPKRGVIWEIENTRSS